jgi:hypothetical protein
VTARQVSDRRRLASAGRIDTIRRATGAIREVCGAWDSAGRRRSRWIFGSQRLELDPILVEFDLTMGEGEGRFHAFDLAKCAPESWRERGFGPRSSDTGGRRGRFPALAGRLVAECGRPAS